MKPGRHFLPPRQAVVYAYTRRMLDETAMNANSFALTVAELYHAQVAPDVRQVPLKLGEGDALARALKDNGQILRRYMDGTVKTLPADLEDAWVMALPEPYRSDCERDLARRRGRFSFALPESVSGEDAACIGEVAQHSGELFATWGRAVADGAITREELMDIEDKSDDAIASLLKLRAFARERTRTDRRKA